MRANLFIDKGRPLVYMDECTLSDGSTVWNLHFRGGQEAHEIIHCESEKAADAAFALIREAIEIATGEAPLVL